jgi:hypothetical protein
VGETSGVVGTPGPPRSALSGSREPALDGNRRAFERGMTLLPEQSHQAHEMASSTAGELQTSCLDPRDPRIPLEALAA